MKRRKFMERKMEYIPFRGRSCDIVRIGIDWFDYRTNEQENELPKVGAFCKHCATETAIPVYPIRMNGNPAYALRCTSVAANIQCTNQCLFKDILDMIYYPVDV